MALDVHRLLRFAQELQQATDVDGLVRAVQREVREVAGYDHSWLAVFEPDGKRARILSFAGDASRLLWEHAPVIPREGDPMMEEIARAQGPVVVLDALTDPRTNKEIVNRLGNRTIVNIPLALIDSPLGALGMGTFGAEGVREPTEAQLEQLVGTAHQLAVAVARIRWQAERARLDRERADVERRIRAAQKLEGLGLLAGGVAHDLNNLLALVLLNAHLVGREPLSQQQRADLEGLALAAQQGSALTRQLLDLSRPQAERPGPVDLHARLRELVELLRRALPQNIAVELVEGAPRPICLGSATQLDQVFMNLCMNARDAMPEGGRLRLETSEVEADPAFVAANPWAQPRRYLRVAVTDTGSGMPPEVVDRIFEPFFTTKAAGRGTGLGLAVAQGVVRQHGGMLRAHSAPGAGTTMEVYLPLHQGGAAEARLEGPAPRGSERILVADDDPGLRAAVSRILEGAGYTVAAVADGAEAAALAGRETFDLAILDIVMPKLSGRHAFEHIRELQPQLPCLFSTGSDAEALASGLGPYEVLRKPYDPEQLLRAVRRALDGR